MRACENCGADLGLDGVECDECGGEMCSHCGNCPICEEEGDDDGET